MKKKQFRSALSDINGYVESTIGNQSETFRTEDISKILKEDSARSLNINVCYTGGGHVAFVTD